MEILHSIFAFIVVLGVLITFHEFGHYIVAKKCGVKILRFSIGFGKPIWQGRYGEDKTEFVVASLPLGGYVKMLDEREGRVDEDELNRAFNNKTLIQRILIVVAGPAFNFMLAIFAYWLMFMLGVTGLKPVIGEIEPASIAANAGFRMSDEIIQVDGVDTPTWSAVVDRTVTNVVKEREVVFRVKDANSQERSVNLDLGLIGIDDMASGQLFKVIGLFPYRPVVPAIIGEILPGGAAEQSGLLAGDHILRVDGKTIAGWGEWVKVIRENPERSLQVELLRDSLELTIPMTPAKVIEESKSVGKIGAGVMLSYLEDNSHLAIESYGSIPALAKAMDKTLEMSLMTLRILGKMIVGSASVKNLSGPISIAQYAGKTADQGLAVFLGFMAIISVSLGVLNLLPIPLLDGGHLFYYLIEFIKGSPVTESFQIAGQQLGLVVLLGLMSIALYNDILRLMG